MPFSIFLSESTIADSDDIGWDEEMDVDEKAEEEETDKQFPDEVNAPLDEPARIRFQNYRWISKFSMLKGCVF